LILLKEIKLQHNTQSSFWKIWKRLQGLSSLLELL